MIMWPRFHNLGHEIRMKEVMITLWLHDDDETRSIETLASTMMNDDQTQGLWCYDWSRTEREEEGKRSGECELWVKWNKSLDIKLKTLVQPTNPISAVVCRNLYTFSAEKCRNWFQPCLILISAVVCRNMDCTFFWFLHQLRTTIIHQP